MLLIESNDSKIIASKLGISKETLSTRRRRSLSITISSKTVDLVMKCIKNGWI
jgi:hypothetical protein